MKRILEFVNSLPMPVCGDKQMKGCLGCTEESCDYYDIIEGNNLGTEKCRKCGGTVWTSYNQFDPSYSCICLDCQEEYVVQYDESRHPELPKEPVLPFLPKIG